MSDKRRKMKDKKKLEALKEYEQTIIQACDIRKVAIQKAEKEFQNTKTEAHKKYLNKVGS
jgi:hypothetical protein